MILNSEELDQVFLIVKTTIEHGFKHDAVPNINPELIPPGLCIPASVIVTLKYKDTVFGQECNISKPKPLYKSVSRAALSAAFRNTKLPQINRNILDQTEVGIYFLSMNRKTSLVVDLDNFCLNLKPSECVLIESGNKFSFLMSESQKEYENAYLLMDALKKTAGIPKQTPWSEIKATTTPVTNFYCKLFKDISCQSSD